jgi:trans-aconitate methyltransferase
MSHLTSLLKLNARVAKLAISGHWMTKEDYRRGYDCVASSYDDAWLINLINVTDDLISKIPSLGSRLPIIELGCGTGYSTGILSRKFPDNKVYASDISENMLSEAKKRTAGTKNISYSRSDMLDYLNQWKNEEPAMIYSSWAMGYSKPAEITKLSSRLLVRNGVLAFVVNLEDTLKPVFDAFQSCMLKYPGKVEKALWPSFPESLESMIILLEKKGFRIEWKEEGFKQIFPPPDSTITAWLLRTGILAGFDSVLSIKNDPAIKDFFEERLQKEKDMIKHHYVSVIAVKE